MKNKFFKFFVFFLSTPFSFAFSYSSQMNEELIFSAEEIKIIENLKKKLIFLDFFSKRINNDENLKLVLFNFFECESIKKTFNNFSCEDLKNILISFFKGNLSIEIFKKINKFDEDISSIEEKKIAKVEIFKETAVIVLLLQSYLISIVSYRKINFTNFKIGFELVLFLYDLSKISLSKLLVILEKYHDELLELFQKYQEDDESNINSEKIGLFQSFLKLQKLKPWTMPALVVFFVYSFYIWKTTK